MSLTNTRCTNSEQNVMTSCVWDGHAVVCIKWGGGGGHSVGNHN